jgi:hypothetical protein
LSLLLCLTLFAAQQFDTPDFLEGEVLLVGVVLMLFLVVMEELFG